MQMSRTKIIRNASSEELLLMSLFGSIEVRRAIARELERRSSVANEKQPMVEADLAGAAA